MSPHTTNSTHYSIKSLTISQDTIRTSTALNISTKNQTIPIKTKNTNPRQTMKYSNTLSKPTEIYCTNNQQPHIYNLITHIQSLLTNLQRGSKNNNYLSSNHQTRWHHQHQCSKTTTNSPKKEQHINNKLPP